MESTPASVKVKAMFDTLTEKLGSEFEILLKIPIDAIGKIAGDKVAESIFKVRNGDIFISPGYDGEYGVVKIESGEKSLEPEKQPEQATLGF